MNTTKPLSTSRLLMSNPVLRALIIYGAFNIGSLLIGGYAIFCIFLGSSIALRYPLILWPPSRAWLGRLLGFDSIMQNPTTNSSRFWKVVRSLYQILISLLYLGFGFLIIRLGIQMLENGFLNQNFIYLLIFQK